MKIPQLSMFMENKPGRLSDPCRRLAEAGINIVTLSLADTQQFGILRLIVRDWEKAKTVLEQAGCVVNVVEVVAIEVAAVAVHGQGAHLSFSRAGPGRGPGGVGSKVRTRKTGRAPRSLSDRPARDAGSMPQRTGTRPAPRRRRARIRAGCCVRSAHLVSRFPLCLPADC